MGRFKRHPRFWAIVGIIFVTMPQWAGAVWSLFVVDRPMVPTIAGWLGVEHMPSPNVLGWVPTLVGLVLLVLVWKQTRERPAVPVQPPPSPILREPPEPLVAPQPAKESRRADAEDDRIFIQKSPVELVAPFKDFTFYKAKKLVADYYTTWVRWIVTVEDVEQYGDTPHIFASFPGKQQLAFISMDFPLSEKARVLLLEKGNVITVEGQITDLESRQVRLTNCRLIEVTPP